ncbi:hypothetical protein DLM45_02305 [Hyphomicrobium methylovorum]|uniref:hypothetical protein n=1 Tax=Hyphomicrobium methylovorum TaxID=84 RepID=UPI0015E7106E|nr:hypothetical protein [Hyphomicrobium methylovorum]MBA2125059.1 hypothetical protein [Hyphomicrobium methylovorum]
MRAISNNNLINGSGTDDPSPTIVENPMQHARMLWRLAADDSVLSCIETMEGKRCEFRVFDLPDGAPFPEGWSQTPWKDEPEADTSKKKAKAKKVEDDEPVSDGDSN